jgi:hypothetical protein
VPPVLYIEAAFSFEDFHENPIIAGNWKLNKTIAEARSFVSELNTLSPKTAIVEIVHRSPFTALISRCRSRAGHKHQHRRAGYVLERFRRLHRRNLRADAAGRRL